MASSASALQLLAQSYSFLRQHTRHRRTHSLYTERMRSRCFLPVALAVLFLALAQGSSAQITRRVNREPYRAGETCRAYIGLFILQRQGFLNPSTTENAVDWVRRSDLASDTWWQYEYQFVSNSSCRPPSYVTGITKWSCAYIRILFHGVMVGYLGERFNPGREPNNVRFISNSRVMYTVIDRTTTNTGDSEPTWQLISSATSRCFEVNPADSSRNRVQATANQCVQFWRWRHFTVTGQTPCATWNF